MPRRKELLTAIDPSGTLIRYRITDDVEYSGDPGDPATPNPPATSSKPKPLPPIYNSPKADPPFNTPESLKVIIDAFEVKLGPSKSLTRTL